ncbi:MAG: hypothetical protein AAF768_03120 [Pseudomonadota bacterium]
MMRRLILAFLVAASGFGAAAQIETETVVFTDVYRPFILPEAEPAGEGTRMVGLILENMKQPYQIRYIDFAYALYAVETTPGTATFPWRKVAEREDKFHFSDTLIETETRVYYNRQTFATPPKRSDLSALNIGRVEAYAYTEGVEALFEEAASRPDTIKTYPGEVEAIRALLAGEIEILPLPSTVMEATTATNFPNQVDLLDTVEGISPLFSLHMIAPRTAAGKDFIDAFNESYRSLVAAGVLTGPISGTEAMETGFGETAELVVSEGFPVIVGRRGLGGEDQFFAIPQGTRVLVLEWSETILRPSKTDRIYRSMVDETQVLILNGPHVGKELFVKNMHISVLE